MQSSSGCRGGILRNPSFISIRLRNTHIVSSTIIGFLGLVFSLKINNVEPSTRLKTEAFDRDGSRVKQLALCTRLEQVVGLLRPRCHDLSQVGGHHDADDVQECGDAHSRSGMYHPIQQWMMNTHHILGGVCNSTLSLVFD